MQDDPVCVAARGAGKKVVTELWVDDTLDTGAMADADRVSPAIVLAYMHLNQPDSCVLYGSIVHCCKISVLNTPRKPLFKSHYSYSPVTSCYFCLPVC
jgi:hypothetical protein